MVGLVDNLVRAYDQSIRELDWMSDETRTQALDKLSKFRANIGYPDVWRDYSAIDIEADDLFGNIERATIAEYEREIARQGGPVDDTEWTMTPQTVNASYRPWKNDITFPAAILQPPFFNYEADDAVNYGAIVCVLLLWSMRTEVQPGFSWHLSGMVALTLMFGWSLAVIAGRW